MHENSLKNLRPWSQGQSGNANGRPVGARGRFTDQFVADIGAAWHKHGSSIVEQMATTEPMRFAELCARLIPRDVSVTLSARLPGNLEPEDWHLVTEVMGAIRQSLPDANQREPGKVMQFVLDAIRSHDAKLIEHEHGTATARTTI